MIMYQQKSPEMAFLAFDELYRRFSSKVFAYLLKKCKNQSDAEDLLQKVFIKIHESKHLYSNKYKFEQWLFVIARTSSLDHFRQQKRHGERIEKLNNETERSLSATRDFQDPLKSLDLDEDQKEMLEMKYIDKISYQEMARLFNKSEGSLRKMVSRMVINLRKGEV